MLKKITPILVLITTLCLAQSDPDVVVSVDATQRIGSLEPFWASQIIHPTESLLTPRGEKLLKLMVENGAARQYVRIYNQPETAAKVAADGSVTYDWSRFDRMAEMILGTGCKLKVMFFGMPKAIADKPEKMLRRSNGSKIGVSPPKDYKAWQELCSDFTRHVIKSYGEEEVKQWTFRCWNEPDLKGFWYKADVEEYLKLYDHFAKGVKDVCPDIRIGGPALSSTHTYKDSSNYKLFLEHVVNGVNHATGTPGVPLDFISVHTYGGSGGGGGPGRKYPETAYLIEQQKRYADMRDAYPQLKDIPIHIEEWGVSSGGTKGMDKQPMTVVRNSEYGAAFMVDWVAQHISMKQANDRNFENFTFCASGYDRKLNDDFMGYRTLDTMNGFHKPILNGYKLLDRLPRELIAINTMPNESGVRAFAARNNERVSVVLVNYQHDKIENEGKPVSFKLKTAFSWPADTQVEMKEWRIDSTHSNGYTAFKQFNSGDSLSPEQMTSIRKKMVLEVMESPKTAACGKLAELSIELPCNGVSLVEFSKVPKSVKWPKFNYPPVIEGAQVETFKKVGDKELKVWIIGADAEHASKPAIVFFYGGGWRRGSPEQFVRQGRYLVERGMVAVMAEYRVASRDKAKPAECVADAKSCMRWLRRNAKRLGINPRMIAAGGGSAGGHLAVATATLPGLDEPGEDCSVSCIPDALILCNAGFMMAPFGELKMKGFGAGMGEKGFGCKPLEISPIHHMRKGLPPALVLHGTADKTIPFATAEVFCEEMKKAGNRCELVSYQGVGHGFYLGERYNESLDEMVSFLNSLGFLPGGM